MEMLKDYWVVIAGLGGGFIFLIRFIYFVIQKFIKIDYIGNKVDLIEGRVNSIEKDVVILKKDMSFLKGKTTAMERMLKTLLNRSNAAIM